VGIGTASPSFPSGTGLAIYNASVPRLKLANSTTGDASTDGTQLLVSGSDFYIQQREAASVFISTNGTNAVTVDASQNVGIGTSSPSANLHVSSSGNTEVLSATTGANYTTFRLKNSTNDYSMQIRTDVSNAWVLRDETAGANRLVVDTSGNVTLAGTLTTAAQSIAKASLPTGSVLQVVTGTTSTAVSNSTTIYTDVGLSASITPTSASSKILVITTIQGVAKSSADAANRMDLKLLRGATQLDDSGANVYTAGTNLNLRISFSHSYYDAPATTSSTTYKWTFRNSNGTASVQVQQDSNSGISQIILMEIAA
jgi:hypothetical protein